MGLSLRDVHAVTAIPLNCLAALEEGDLSQLPSPVYARGYIRSYAEAVRVDGDSLALELWRGMEEAQVATSGSGHAVGPRPRGRSSLHTAPRPPAGAAPHQRARPPNGRRPSNLAPLRQPTSPWVPRPGRIKRMAPALERVAIGLLLIVLAVGIWDLQRSRPVKTPKPQAQGTDISQTHATAPPAAATTTPPPSTISTTPVSDNGSLAVYATGRDRFAVMTQATDAPCWLQVRAGPGGPVLFEGTLQPGEVRPFDATRALWVRLGNLGHASVLVDGAPLVLPNKPSFPYNLLLQA
jgi:cytoskeleton protein RodZ